MEMTNEEIVRMYLMAKDKREQIGILADLNCCKKEKIREILIDAGIDHRKLPRERKKGTVIEDQTPEEEFLKEMEKTHQIPEETVQETESAEEPAGGGDDAEEGVREDDIDGGTEKEGMSGDRIMDGDVDYEIMKAALKLFGEAASEKADEYREFVITAESVSKRCKVMIGILAECIKQEDGENEK